MRWRYIQGFTLESSCQKIEILKNIDLFSKKASELGFVVCAGHGLNYHNVDEICGISEIVELNIGYSIITRSIFVGLDKLRERDENILLQKRVI